MQCAARDPACQLGIEARAEPSLTWFGWVVPDLLSAAIVLVIGVVLLGVAIAEFSRVE